MVSNLSENKNSLLFSDFPTDKTKSKLKFKKIRSVSSYSYNKPKKPNVTTITIMMWGQLFKLEPIASYKFHKDKLNPDM